MHTLKAISKYSLTEAHRSSMFLDVPFLNPFSVKIVAFLMDIAEINNDSRFRYSSQDRVTNHIVHLKVHQMLPEEEEKIRMHEEKDKSIYPQSVLILNNALRRELWSYHPVARRNISLHINT